MGGRVGFAVQGFFQHGGVGLVCAASWVEGGLSTDMLAGKQRGRRPGTASQGPGCGLKLYSAGRPSRVAPESRVWKDRV